VKWSYRKLILWSVLVFLSIGWIVFYINTGITSGQRVGEDSLAQLWPDFMISSDAVSACSVWSRNRTP